MTPFTDIPDSQERETIGLPPNWEIEVGDVYGDDEDGTKRIDIWAVKEGEERQCVVWGLPAHSDPARILKACQNAVRNVQQLNTKLASPKPGIREKLLDVLDTIKGETK